MGKDFKEDMIWLSHAWEDWSETEQIVALYSIARKLNAIPTRFLQILLLYNCHSDNATLIAAETRANDPAWISKMTENEDILTELLHHFPLLRPANIEVKNNYLKLIHNSLSRILLSNMVLSFHLENARHLLSYALIHPALSTEERRSFSKYIKAMEFKLMHGMECKDSEEILIKDSETITSHDKKIEKEDEKGINKEGNVWLQFDEPFSTHSNVPTTSESEHNTEENSDAPRIKDLGAWLKSLRLHKYLTLLSTLEYDELLALTEETLEQRGVTKGARHKIILSIAKLKDRPKQLEDIEKELTSGGSVASALNQLKALVITPMPPSHFEENSAALEDTEKESNMQQFDLPSQFVRVLGKVCTQLLVSVRPEDESVSTFLNLIDKCLNHEAFTLVHARRFLSWKQQILRIWAPLPTRAKENRHNRRWSHQYSGEMFSHNVRGGRYSQRFPSWSPSISYLTPATVVPTTHLSPHTMFPFPPTLSTTLLAPRSSVKGVTSMGSSPLLSPQHFLAKRPSLQETPCQLRPHVSLQRTRSAPSRPHDPSHRGAVYSAGSKTEYQSPRPKKPDVSFPDVSQPPSTESKAQMAELDITNRLESLCLSMTKHALE